MSRLALPAQAKTRSLLERPVADLVRLLRRQPAGRDGLIQEVVTCVLEGLGDPLLGKAEMLGETLDEARGRALAGRRGGRLGAGDPAESPESRADEPEAEDGAGHRRAPQDSVFERPLHGTPFPSGDCWHLVRPRVSAAPRCSTYDSRAT